MKIKIIAWNAIGLVKTSYWINRLKIRLIDLHFKNIII